MLASACFSHSLFAKDLGVQGTTFPIAERNLMDVIDERLASADFQAKQQQVEDYFLASAQNPRPVLRLSAAQEYHSFTWDPTVVLKEDLVDHQDNILFAAGTTINPLDYVAFAPDLLIFDGDDPDQIEWARQQTEEVTWLLIAGSPMDLKQQEGREVYFDQGGELCQKLGIAAVPCRVSQQDELLFIEEFPANPNTYQDDGGGE